MMKRIFSQCYAYYYHNAKGVVFQVRNILKKEKIKTITEYYKKFTKIVMKTIHQNFTKNQFVLFAMTLF